MDNVIIIGSGPAGISASLYLKRANKDVTVVSSGIGALSFAEKIENYYGIESISGTKLYETGLKQAQNLGVKIVKDEIFNLSFDGQKFELYGKESNYDAKYVVIATGNGRKRLNAKNLKTFEGKGVSYCAVCDGYFYKNLIVAVVGNSEYALHEAKYLKQIAQKVYILTNGKKPAFESSEFEIIEDKILSFEGDALLNKVKFENIELHIDGVFVALGSASSNDFAQKIGAEIDNEIVVTDKNCQTSIPNLYVIGDANGGMNQICKAVYEGAVVANDIIEKQK